MGVESDTTMRSRREIEIEAANGNSPDTFNLRPNQSARITVDEIARRLEIGRVAVYQMLEAGLLPGIRLGRRWIITRYAYEKWEKTCGSQAKTGLSSKPEVMVVN